MKAQKLERYLGVISDYKLTFEEHIKSKVHIHNMLSDFYSVQNHQQRIRDKFIIRFIRSSVDYDNATLITAETKNVSDWNKFK